MRSKSNVAAALNWARSASVRWLAPALAAGLFAACRPAPPAISDAPLADHELARIGSEVISVKNFLAERARSSSTESSSDLLERLIQRELLYAEARRVGFDQSPALKAAWKNLVIQRFQDSLESPKKTTGITQDAIEAEYTGHPERYSTTPQVRAALIQLPAATSEARLAELQTAALQIPAGTADFGALAVQSLHPPSRRLGGDLGWLTQTQAALAFPPEVVSALFTLARPGEVSPPVKTREGVFLLKLVEVRSSQTKPLEAVREQIAFHLKRQQRLETEHQRFAHLRSLHSVDTALDRLPAISPNPATVAVRPPRLPQR